MRKGLSCSSVLGVELESRSGKEIEWREKGGRKGDDDWGRLSGNWSVGIVDMLGVEEDERMHMRER